MENAKKRKKRPSTGQEAKDWVKTKIRPNFSASEELTDAILQAFPVEKINASYVRRWDNIYHNRVSPSMTEIDQMTTVLKNKLEQSLLELTKTTKSPIEHVTDTD